MELSAHAELFQHYKPFLDKWFFDKNSHMPLKPLIIT